MITYTLEGRARVIAKQIPIFDADLKEGGRLFSGLIHSILIALA